MQKIVTNHSTNCPGLINVLKTFVNNNYDDIIKCNPARMSRTKQSSEHFDLRVKYQVGGGGSFKCIARSGTIVQDVFIVVDTKSPLSNIKNEEDLSKQINLSFPRRAIKTKKRKAQERINKNKLNSELYIEGMNESAIIEVI